MSDDELNKQNNITKITDAGKKYSYVSFVPESNITYRKGIDVTTNRQKSLLFYFDKNLYELIINKDDILFINTLSDAIKFSNNYEWKYNNKHIEEKDNGKIIWDMVMKDYKGIQFNNKLYTNKKIEKMAMFKSIKSSEDIGYIWDVSAIFKIKYIGDIVPVYQKRDAQALKLEEQINIE